MNAALRTIPTRTIIETNHLIYTAVTVILEILDYKVNTISHKDPYPAMEKEVGGQDQGDIERS